MELKRITGSALALFFICIATGCLSTYGQQSVRDLQRSNQDHQEQTDREQDVILVRKQREVEQYRAKREMELQSLQAEAEIAKAEFLVRVQETTERALSGEVPYDYVLVKLKKELKRFSKLEREYEQESLRLKADGAHIDLQVSARKAQYGFLEIVLVLQDCIHRIEMAVASSENEELE